MPYRDNQIFQPITNDVHRYVLAARRYEFCAPPVHPENPNVMVSAIH